MIYEQKYPRLLQEVGDLRLSVILLAIKLKDKNMMGKQQKLVVSGATLLILSLGIVSLITLLPKAEIVRAREVQPKKVARANSWLAASFPVENFQAYTSGFGYRASATGGSNWEFHGGLDIAAPQGSYIRNWWVGTVVKVSDGDACGSRVVIKSGEWEHTYCHMEGNVETASGRRYLIDRAGGIQIWEGQQIPTGARIGRVGMTGRTTGPHLHWGLKYDNNYVDPALVLREMFSQKTVTRRDNSRVRPQQSKVIIQESKVIRD